MKVTRCILILIFFCVLFVLPVNAGVEQHVVSTIRLSQSVIDMDVSKNSEKIFVLNEQGKVLIYDRTGALENEISVGDKVSGFKIGSNGDALFLYSKDKSMIEVVDLVFVYDINVLGSPYKGPVDAPVTVVVFSDFQCPYCARVANFMDEILLQYPKEVKYVFKHYPLTSHEFAATAAHAAVAAQDQGKFWEFHDLMFKNFNRLNQQIVEDISKALKLDSNVFKDKIQAPETIAKVRSDKQEGREAGVRGTPALYVNGKKVERNSFENILSAIRAEMVGDNGN